MGFRFEVWGVYLCKAWYPCADGTTLLPGIFSWRHVLRPANLVDSFQDSIEVGFPLNSPPAVRRHPDYFLAGFRATPTIPTTRSPAEATKRSLEVRCLRAPHPCRGLRGFRVGLGYSHQGENNVQSCASRCMRAAPGSCIRPFSIGSSHCLTQGRLRPNNGWEWPKQAGWVVE